MFGLTKKLTMIAQADALPGRDMPIPAAQTHTVFGTPMRAQPLAGEQAAMFAMGCFWGVERLFWQLDGVTMTNVGYANGFTPNPTYDEVCTGKTGHTEVVWIAFDPARVTYDDLLRVFWENHDPTQGMAQGNDRGTQYRSGIYAYGDDQLKAALASRDAFAAPLAAQGYGAITTEIMAAPAFYHAEEYHQQYLDKNPGGYCGLKGTGVQCVG